MGFSVISSRAEGAPFAYVNTGTVIDTATNKVVGTLAAPKYVYTTSFGFAHGTGRVLVTDTLTNKVVATLSHGHRWEPGRETYQHGVCTKGCTEQVFEIDATTNKVVGSTDLGTFSEAVAVIPDGKFVYVVSFYDGIVSILNADLSFAGSVSVGNFPIAVAIAPDGKHAYVANQGDSSVSVIDTATRSVTATVTVGVIGQGGPDGVAIAPNGQRAYVSTLGNVVSVINTATNAVVANVPVAEPQSGIRHAGWKTRLCHGADNVNAIATATNALVAKIPVGGSDIAIVPPPPGVPFLTFSAEAVIHFGSGPNQDDFAFHSHFTLSSTDSNGINPLAEPRVRPLKESFRALGGVAVTPGGKHASVAGYDVSSIDTAIKCRGAKVLLGGGRSPLFRHRRACPSNLRLSCFFHLVRN